MTDAGFFRGTSADQDNRFANKQKKLLKEINSPILSSKINTSKLDIESIKPWIENKIKEILEKDDELLSQSIFEHLAEKEPDGKLVLMLITGFVDETRALKFMEELWAKLIELQENSNGIDKVAGDTASGVEKSSNDTESNRNDKLNEGNNNEDDDQNKNSQDNHEGSSSSHSVSPPSRSVSKSPGNHRLDEHSRGRPRRRLLGEGSKDGSKSPDGARKKDRSRSRSSSGMQSRSRSRSNSGTSRSQTPRKDGAAEDGEPKAKLGSKSKSRSRSRSGSHSVSKSHSGTGSRSRSKSYSRSHSRSSSRSPRPRSRSPYHSYRGRRSRSRSIGYVPRSRSPRIRRGYPIRGPYRGPPYHDRGYQDRRRGMMGPIRRRPSPWSSRRRYSPRSPIRRRRTPSYSPRRRRSPSPYRRRISRSRTPPGHMMGRSMQSPRSHNMHGMSHADMLGPRHLPHHDMHRHGPPPRSPKRLIDQRSYGEGHILPRHSPLPVMSKQLEMPPAAHHLIPSNPPGPSGSGLHSPPSSGKKKHKKDKKHRKHKKSRKHRSPSPEKRKKHKKHKKAKKHKH